MYDENTDGNGLDWIAEGWASDALPAGDPARPFGYLLGSRRCDYVPIMDVLERSVDPLTPREVACQLADQGVELSLGVVTQRLRALDQTYLAVSGRPDSDIEHYHELSGARWRYSSTPRGRQVQRLYAQMATEGTVHREVAVDGLARILDALVRIDSGAAEGLEGAARLAGGVFVEHDSLDAALVGQADMLAQLAHRFDLDATGTVELKSLLVDYATHVVTHLDRGVALIHDRLKRLRPRFEELATAMKDQSHARKLVARGVLAPSRGLRTSDWEQLLRWFSPGCGQAERFGMQLVRAIPMMHTNLRRHQSQVGPGTLRAKALSLAMGCRDPQFGRAVERASLGDHPWMKLHTAAEGGSGEVLSWHEGPRVPALAMLRKTGQSRPRGRVGARRPRGPAVAVAAEQRRQREAAREAAVSEVLAGQGLLSDAACRAALRAVMAAVRVPEKAGRRVGKAGGLGCTLVVESAVTGRVDGLSWSVLLPGRTVRFHPPGQVPAAEDGAECGATVVDTAAVTVVVEAVR
ncbi:DUF2397 family protein [Streptomyces sp. NPDC048272]|uniref:DUF2397 family protein n=1 Tax=Streptomyces sp. NPDC048272 TaxID=3154616 RepID=UPI0034383F2E